MNREDEIKSLDALKPGDRVIETALSSLHGRKGTIVSLCPEFKSVAWDNLPGESGGFQTGVTHGTRLIKEETTPPWLLSFREDDLMIKPGGMTINHIEKKPIYGSFWRWLIRRPVAWDVTYTFELLGKQDDQ